jgi:hypothetical protein
VDKVAHLHLCLFYVIIKKVKSLARLALFFSLGFAVLFFASTGLRFLAIRVEWVRTLSLGRETLLAELIAAAHWALTFTLYGGILLGLNYAARNKVFSPASTLCIILLTMGFVYGISLGLDNWENVPPAKTPTQPLGGPGVILSNTAGSSGTVLVLLQGSIQPGGARVVATPGRPLIYQTEFVGRDQALVSLPPAQFSNDTPWFLKSLSIDLRLSTQNLQRRLNQGMSSFLIYAGALIFFLCSCMFIQKLSVWPLANLFLGCLAFRGILSLELFFNSPEMQDVFDSFLQSRLPISLVVPIIFTGFGLLIFLYSFLVFVAKRQSNNE